MAVCRPVDLLERLASLRKSRPNDATSKRTRTPQRRIGRRAAMPGNGESAAALAYLSAVDQSVSSSQPFSNPEKKPSPAPRTLKTSIGKPGPVRPSSRLSGIAPLNATAPLAPRLQTSVASGHATNGPERPQCPSGHRQYGTLPRYRRSDRRNAVSIGVYLSPPTLHEPALALAVTGDAPEVGTIVNVERRPRPMFAGKLEGLQHRRFSSGWHRWVPVTRTARA